MNYDDGSYVFENANIRGGLTWHGVVWALTHIHSQNWHPLTSISHMLDCEIQPKQSSSQNAQPILPGGNNPIVYRTLAATLAKSGQFDVAIWSAEQARKLSQGNANAVVADEMARWIALFKQGRTLRQARSSD